MKHFAFRWCHGEDYTLTNLTEAVYFRQKFDGSVYPEIRYELIVNMWEILVQFDLIGEWFQYKKGAYWIFYLLLNYH